MFPFCNDRKHRMARRAQPNGMEPLEGRQLLSASACLAGGPHSGPSTIAALGGPDQNAIAFSLLPTTIQTGLTTLATTDGLTGPTGTTLVLLGDKDGVETYSVTISSTGTVSRLTVDAAGNPVTAPTASTTTFGALPSAAAAEITAIATAKSLAAPTSDATVNVSTTAAGVATYSVSLAPAEPTGTTPTYDHVIAGGPAIRFSPGAVVSVDAAGNPVGNQQLPLSVIPAAAQTALTAGAPAAATALTSTSTVDLRTTGGLTTYSVRYTVSGTDTTLLVDATGAAVTPASQTTADFSTLPAAAQTELQALATAKGYAGTIATTQSVDVYAEVGGATTLYAVTLSVADSTSSTRTHDVTFVVDASGDPTVLALNAATPIGDPSGPPVPGFPGAGDFSPDPTDGSTGGSSAGSTTGTPTVPTSGSSSGTSTSAGFVATLIGGSPAAFTAASAVLSPDAPTLGPALGLFAAVASNATVKSDLATLKADAAAIRSATKSLSAADKATLKADEKALGAAVKALSATLAPGEKTLKSDAAKYAATLKADAKAIRKDHANATALAADEATLASDEAAAFADLEALKALIAADAGVTAAESKLATDVPTVAAATATAQSDYSKLVTDVGAAISST